jgi:hypothetical protein
MNVQQPAYIQPIVAAKKGTAELLRLQPFLRTVAKLALAFLRQQQTRELLNALHNVWQNLAKQPRPAEIVGVGRMYLLRPSIPRETATLADGCPIPPIFPPELGHGLGHYLRIKVSRIPVRPLLCFIFLFSIFPAYTLIVPVVSRPLPLPVSQPNRSDEQRSTATYSSSFTSSVRARDQLGSDSAIATTSTTVDNPPAPEPRHQSTQNVNRVPAYTNPWGM